MKRLLIFLTTILVTHITLLFYILKSDALECERLFDEERGFLIYKEKLCSPSDVLAVIENQVNEPFGRYMTIASLAAQNGDYNTAIINFKRAEKISLTFGANAISPYNAQLGLKSAEAAKAVLKRGGSPSEASEAWYEMSGLGKLYD